MAEDKFNQQLINISGNNQELLNYILDLIKNKNGLKLVLKMEKLPFSGDKLLKFKDTICKNDPILFEKTIDMINEGIFDDKDIDANLNLENPISFIHETITPSLLKPFDDEEYRKNNWESFCDLSSQIFKRRLNEENKDIKKSSV